MRRRRTTTLIVPLLLLVLVAVFCAPVSAQRKFVVPEFKSCDECGCLEGLLFDANETNLPFDRDSFAIAKGIDPGGTTWLDSILFLVDVRWDLNYTYDSKHVMEMMTLLNEGNSEVLPLDKYYLLSPSAQSFVQTLRDSIGSLRVWSAGASRIGGVSDRADFRIWIKFDTTVTPRLSFLKSLFTTARQSSLDSAYPLSHINTPFCYELTSSVKTDTPSKEVLSSTISNGHIQLPADTREYRIVNINGVSVSSGVVVKDVVPAPIPVPPGVYLVETNTMRLTVLVLP